jgi:hypothetical protein
MGVTKPYYRIIRPFHYPDTTAIEWFHYWKVFNHPYLLDARYANDRAELWRAYMLIEKDLLRLFEYIEPTDGNLSAFSHRTYELLLRTATEFETNCKRILMANRYEKNRNLNITDYFKLNLSSRLADYSVSLMEWHPGPKTLKPFEEWGTEEEYRPLPWYQSYNHVKHDRNLNFPNASLQNVINAVAGLYVILFSQFFVIDRMATGNTLEVIRYHQVFNQETMSKWGDIFHIDPPRSWAEDELYDFDWDTLKDSPDPFAKFPF